MEESCKFRAEDALVYKDVRNNFKVFSFVVFILRLALMIDAIEVHYQGHMPYQLWLSVGVFGTVYLEFAFNRNLDMVCQIVTLRRLRKLISLSSKDSNTSKMNLSCSVSLMTWNKMLRVIQLTSLDYIGIEDVLISLYISWFLLLVVIVICDKIYRFDDTVNSSDMLWVYSIDLFTLCYQIIVRLFYGEKVNAQLAKMQLELSEIHKFFRDLQGYLKPLLSYDISEIKYSHHRFLLNCLKYSFPEPVSHEVFEDRVGNVVKTLKLCIKQMNDLVNDHCYKFLGLIPCNKKFFYSVLVSLLTIAGSAFFSQYWKHT